MKTDCSVYICFQMNVAVGRMKQTGEEAQPENDEHQYTCNTKSMHVKLNKEVSANGY